MSKSENRPSAGIEGIYFPRVRKGAKRLVAPRMQARVYVENVSFNIEISAPLEGLKRFERLSLPMLGGLFLDLAELLIKHESRQPKAGRTRAYTARSTTSYDCAIETAKLLGPPLWQWLTANPQNVSDSAKLFGLNWDCTAKDVLAHALEKNWNAENDSWPGVSPSLDPDSFFKKLNRHKRLEMGYSLLLLPPANMLVRDIAKGVSYCYRMVNGYCSPPESVCPPIRKNQS